MLFPFPKAGSLAFTPPGDGVSEVVSFCLPHRQLWMSNLSMVASQWLEVDSNRRPSGYKAQNMPYTTASHNSQVHVFTTKFNHTILHNFVGRGGALVETMTFNRRVVGSITALAAT